MGLEMPMPLKVCGYGRHGGIHPVRLQHPGQTSAELGDPTGCDMGRCPKDHAGASNQDVGS